MRTNIVIDDKTMKEAMKLTKLKTKREVVDLALRELVQSRGELEIRKAFGKFKMEHHLERSRLGKRFK